MVVAKTHNISLKPEKRDFFEAAAAPNVALTAYLALVKKFGLTQGQNDQLKPLVQQVFTMSAVVRAYQLSEGGG